MYLVSWCSFAHTQRKKQFDDVHCWTSRGYNSALASFYLHNLLRIANLTSGMLEVFGNGNDDTFLIKKLANWYIVGAQLI